jgi:DNA-binding NarL/FixJ family response regulator
LVRRFAAATSAPPRASRFAKDSTCPTAAARPRLPRADKELRATGAKPRKLLITGVDALTESERRIAEMAAKGLSNREIAQALFAAAKTIETHMGHLFQKLDIHARGELAPLLREAVEATVASQCRY